MRKIAIGILAHVDAGKTTLSEAILFSAGIIKKQGRVDHKDAFFDTDVQERARGITIFSKQAEFEHGDIRFMLLDTPGHVDFSAEMERTLRVLDYAVLVVSGKDGIQGHTMTLWQLLKKHDIPVFVFVNKMDLDGTNREMILSLLKQRLDNGCIAFDTQRDSRWQEQIAMCDEDLFEEFVETDSISDRSIRKAVRKRRIFPCFFGSALMLEGVENFLDGMVKLCNEREHADEFGAKIYKITRDDRGERLTHMKITGGSLKVKDVVKLADGRDMERQEEQGEKIEQIRIYSGEKYRNVSEVFAGQICAVTGLKSSFAGQGLGFEDTDEEHSMESVLIYKVTVNDGSDIHDVLAKLKLLEEEDPQLHVIWNEQQQEIQMKLMGEVQVEILKELIGRRFGFDIEFEQGSISYKETIAKPVVGSGHFEPLRHYAEVHLLLEPGERGSGLIFDSSCSEDELDGNWQNLIITHLGEKEHIGVLTGSPITDMKITVLAGKAHLKHTEGGDFRQATYRALRQGLRKAESVLLEPWYDFRLEVPSEMVGRAMSDIHKMSGIVSEPDVLEKSAVLRGKAPVFEMKDYAKKVASYTKGYGNLSCVLSGYEPCHNGEQVIEEIGYDVETDMENTADSVFCQNGIGFTVKWDKVDDYVHIQAVNPYDLGGRNGSIALDRDKYFLSGKKGKRKKTLSEEEELDRIFEMTYGKPKERKYMPKREILSEKDKVKTKPAKVLEEYLLVDGYNIIFAWEELQNLAKINMDSAREALIEILANYQGYKKCHVIVVFDAYKIKGGERRFEKHDNVDVVFTAEAETADMYIERTAYEKSGDYHVRVATSDRLEQMIIVGSGAFKLSAEEFRVEIQQTNTEITRLIEAHNMRNRRGSGNRIVIPRE